MFTYDQFSLHIRDDGKIIATLTTAEGKHRNIEAQLALSEELRPFITTEIERLESGRLEEKELELLGENLYKALFPETINAEFVTAWRGARREREKRLRVSISMDADSEVVTWPLEFLRGSLGWLATDRDLTLSRRIVFEEEYFEPNPDEPPLKVLVMVSQPNKFRGVMSAKVIEAIAEWAQLEEPRLEAADRVLTNRAARPGPGNERGPKVEVRLLGIVKDFVSEIPGIEYLKRPATFAELRAYSGESDWRPQVLHFIGHGRYLKNEGSLAMVDEANNVDWIEASSFANMVGEINPRLVVLQACQSAKPGTSPSFLSLAALLVQGMIPAVVAMQFSIRNDYATLFSSEFYRALASGEEIDAAVQMGRWKIPNDPEKKLRWKERHFGAPVLYMLHPNGIIRPVSTLGQQRSVPAGSAIVDAPQPLSFNREQAGAQDKFTWYMEQAIAARRIGEDETAHYMMQKAQDWLKKNPMESTHEH